VDVLDTDVCLAAMAQPSKHLDLSIAWQLLVVRRHDAPKRMGVVA
jgi:hypothetical protein